MKSWALLSSNLPSVIDRSNLSPHRFTDQIYHRAAKRRGDKLDRLMTRGKLQDNDKQLFTFISILKMTQLHARDPENRQQNRFSEWCFSEKKNSYNWLNGKAWLGLLQLGLIGGECSVRVRWLNRGKESSHIRIFHIFDMCLLTG